MTLETSETNVRAERPFSAVLLAAGRSTRMGRDKALLEVDGTPLWQRQRDLLAAAGAAEIFLSARPDQAWVRTARGFSAVLEDAFPDAGPIVGLTAGLERASHPLIAVLAIDLPQMTVAWFSSLLNGSSPGVGLVGRRGDFFEPLAALYPREMMWVAWDALARGDYSLQHLVASGLRTGVLREREIGATEAAWFTNWNEPAGGRGT